MPAFHSYAESGVAHASFTSSLLGAWEQGTAQPPLARALTLLAAARPEKSAGDWAQASIGERDRALLRLREELFGPRLEAAAVCPSCGERVQLTFATGDILVHESASSSDLSLMIDGYEIHYRLPTSVDLLEFAPDPDLPSENKAGMLLARCVESARKNTEAIDASALPPSVIDAVGAGMALADPQAEVRISLDCPVCSHQWTSLFDILSFLWGEIEDWVERLLREVHVLASAYGWSERDIVALSPRRRRIYLDMVGD